MIEFKKSSTVLIFNNKGELALQFRAHNDNSFPSHWDFSASGGINPEEDYNSAAKRELKEELGIDTDVRFICEEHYIYPAWNPSNTRDVKVFFFEAFHNGPFYPDPEEVEKVQSFKLETIKQMMESGQKFHPEFILAWNKGIISEAREALIYP